MDLERKNFGIKSRTNYAKKNFFDKSLGCVRKTAEVTLGGVDTRQLSSKTMAVLDRPNLYFIGEVVDVTGHLGGHNFQWAWASVCGGE